MAFKKDLKFTSVLAASLMAVSLPLHAQGQPAPDNNGMMALAHEAGTYAGAARFCNADEDLIDEYIAKIEAKIQVLGGDEYERTVGKLEFKNVLTAASAKEPEGGCDAFLPRFEAAVKGSS